MIRFQCPIPECGQRMKASEEYAGFNFTCPRCEQRVTVPERTAPKDEPMMGEVDDIPEVLPAEEEGKAIRLAKWVTDKGIEGVPPVLSSAASLAAEWKASDYPTDDARIDRLIQWETGKNFTSGFLTGLGGVLWMPVTLPAAFGASWVIQTRMCAAIAKIRGYDIDDLSVRTFVLACLLGDAIGGIAKAGGITVGSWAAKSLIAGIPGSMLKVVNRQIGIELTKKAGSASLLKTVPVVGGVVGGAFDAYSCRLAGRVAKEWFKKVET